MRRGVQTGYDPTSPGDESASPGLLLPRIVAWEQFAHYLECVQAKADGVIMNTFEEMMEPEYVAGYAAGPVSLYHQLGHSGVTLATRGNATAAIDADECLRWLDGRQPDSVVYVDFGSIARADAKQVVELVLGLEASGHPFVWAHALAAEARAAMQEGGSSHSNLFGVGQPLQGGFVMNAAW